MNKFAGVCCLLSLWCGSVWAASPAEDLVAKKASILEKMHQKSSKALVNVAQDESFGKYFTATDEAGHATHKKAIDNISLNTQSQFQVEEMCLIDVKGAEISRIVGSKVADDLAENESSSPFFKPSFEQKPKTVFISEPYVSPDASKWVLAYVTPVLVNNEKKAILHYEMGLDTFQGALNKELSGSDTFLVAVTGEGWMVSDSRKEIPVAKIEEKTAPEEYFSIFKFGGQDTAALMKSLESAAPVTESGAAYVGAFKKVDKLILFAFKKQ